MVLVDGGRMDARGAAELRPKLSSTDHVASYPGECDCRADPRMTMHFGTSGESVPIANSFEGLVGASSVRGTSWSWRGGFE